MLSNLNTLIGFAAVFAILSLMVTSIAQLARTLLGMKTQSLIECLERLFGELKDTPRFVAAILSHPSLEGRRGKEHYKILTDPAASAKDVAKATAAVLGSSGDPDESPNSLRLKLRKYISIPWPKTSDLDKQTIKDIGQTVYEQIGHLVDYDLDENGSSKIKEWAVPLKQALEDAETKRMAAITSSVSATGETPRFPAGGLQTSAVKCFRGRMWALATAAFPEAEGKTPPLKTYVSAFHDEADSSASDSFTWRMRGVTVFISLILAFLVHLDAVKIWQTMSKSDPDRLAKLETSALALAPNSSTASSLAQTNVPNYGQIRTNMLDGISALKASNLDLMGGERPSVLGFILAVTALSLGAPFWFETLKSGIQLKSAFDKSDD